MSARNTGSAEPGVPSAHAALGALGTAVFVAVMAGVSATAATDGAGGGASAGIDAAFLTMAGVTAVALFIALFVLRSGDANKAVPPAPAEAVENAQAHS